jgi:hypothetical protein
VTLLVEHGRAWEALELLNVMLHDKRDLEVEQIKSALQSILTVRAPPRDVTMSGYNVAQVLEYMERVVPEDEDLPRFEFYFFELLHDHRPSDALYRALGRDSEDFVNMVSAIYRGEGESKRTLTESEKAFAHLSFSVLRAWPKLPGLRDDGTIDAQHLTEWVRTARLALSDTGRGSIGDEQIGQILAASPVGADGAWPAEPVREIIESIGNARIDTGVSIGKTNQRGVTSRDIFEGGEQERALEREYRDMAVTLGTRWPRTARILRGIADGYKAEARQNDARAERMADDG